MSLSQPKISPLTRLGHLSGFYYRTIKNNRIFFVHPNSQRWFDFPEECFQDIETMLQLYRKTDPIVYLHPRKPQTIAPFNVSIRHPGQDPETIQVKSWLGLWFLVTSFPDIFLFSDGLGPPLGLPADKIDPLGTFFRREDINGRWWFDDLGIEDSIGSISYESQIPSRVGRVSKLLSRRFASRDVKVTYGPAFAHTGMGYHPVKYSKRIEDDLGRSNTHMGQDKLLFSEIEFLTRVCMEMHQKGVAQPRIIAVYPGGGPAIHIPFLADMFPTVRFILVDPVFKKPLINLHSSIYYVAGMFEVDQYLNLHDADVVALISDIRLSPTFPDGREMHKPTGRDPAKYRASYDAAFDRGIVRDMELQKEWLVKFKETYGDKTAALFKFRLLYRPGKTTYFSSSGYSLHFQVFAKPASSELRYMLLPGQPIQYETYDNTDMEEKIFGFNVQRSRQNYFAFDLIFGVNYDIYKASQILKGYLMHTIRAAKASDIMDMFYKIDYFLVRVMKHRQPYFTKIFDLLDPKLV